MIEIRYTLLAEGFAELGFIPEIPRQIGENKYHWVKSKLNIPKPSNRARVLAKLMEFSETSLLRNKEDLFIAGVDLDKQETEKEMPLWHQEREEILKKLSRKILHEKVVIFIPIQAIDYWLLYLSDPQIVANSIEARNRDDVKKRVYENRNDGTSMQKKARELASLPNSVTILRKRSRSFEKFVCEVEDFLKK